MTENPPPNSYCGPLKQGLLGAGPHLGVGVASTLVGQSLGPARGRGDDVSA